MNTEEKTHDDVINEEIEKEHQETRTANVEVPPKDEQKNYVGVKAVTAFKEEKSGQSGYGVIYENGYQSWSPKDVFEKAYIEVGNENKITIDNVKSFIKTTEVTKIGDKTTLVRAILVNGYEIIEHSSCVDPKNYDEEVGTKYAMQKIESKVWMLLGFLLQTAQNGIAEPIVMGVDCCASEPCEPDECNATSEECENCENPCEDAKEFHNEELPTC